MGHFRTSVDDAVGDGNTVESQATPRQFRWWAYRLLIVVAGHDHGTGAEVHGSKWVTPTSITLILPCAGGAVDNVLADVDGVGGQAEGKGQRSTFWPSWSHRKQRPRNR